MNRPLGFHDQLCRNTYEYDPDHARNGFWIPLTDWAEIRNADPVHLGELLATIHHSLAIGPATIDYNHLNQPRELIKAEATTRLLA